MRIFMFVSFLLLMGLVYSIPVETSESSEDFIGDLMLKAVHNYLSKKCASENDSTKNATEILPNIAECLVNIWGASIFGKPGSPFCESPETIEQVPECFLPAIDLLKACGDDEEKFLPEFIIDAVRNLINFACDDERKNGQKLNQDSTFKCYQAIAEDSETTLNPSCEVEGGGFFAMLDDGVITKKELCDVMEAIKVCNINMFEKKCPDDSYVKEKSRGIIDAITGSCSK